MRKRNLKKSKLLFCAQTHISLLCIFPKTFCLHFFISFCRYRVHDLEFDETYACFASKILLSVSYLNISYYHYYHHSNGTHSFNAHLNNAVIYGLHFIVDHKLFCTQTCSNKNFQKCTTNFIDFLFLFVFRSNNPKFLKHLFKMFTISIKKSKQRIKNINQFFSAFKHDTTMENDHFQWNRNEKKHGHA